MKRLTKEGYQRNKYLEDIGIPIENYGTNYCGKEDKRWKKWKNERKKYGFDARECWNLDSSFVEWIYSHFKKYKEDACIDLSFHKFQYNKNDKNVEITQEEAIDIICDACENYLLTSFVDRDFLSKDVMLLIGDVMPSMWW